LFHSMLWFRSRTYRLNFFFSEAGIDGVVQLISRHRVTAVRRAYSAVH
jgi:hypothetical protein